MPLTAPISAILFDSGVLAAPAASIDTGAGGFATAYRDLQLTIYGRSDKAAVVFDTLTIQFNGDTGANYDFVDTGMHASSTLYAEGDVTTAISVVTLPAATATANAFATVNVWIPNYAGTVGWKALTGHAARIDANTAANLYVRNFMGVYQSTSAISRVKIAAAGGNLIAGSRLVVRGL